MQFLYFSAQKANPICKPSINPVPMVKLDHQLKGRAYLDNIESIVDMLLKSESQDSVDMNSYDDMQFEVVTSGKLPPTDFIARVVDIKVLRCHQLHNNLTYVLQEPVP